MLIYIIHKLNAYIVVYNTGSEDALSECIVIRVFATYFMLRMCCSEELLQTHQDQTGQVSKCWVCIEDTTYWISAIIFVTISGPIGWPNFNVAI